MASTEADICNLALARVGQKEFISSLTDNTTPSKLCAVLYPASRDTALASFPWPFAGKHAVLNQLSPQAGSPYVTARAGWQYAFSLTADFLAARYIFNGVRPGASTASSPAASGDIVSWGTPPSLNIVPGARVPYEIEIGDDGSTLILLTDWSGVSGAGPELVYTSKITAVPAFHPLFTEALAWKLAAELAMALPVKAVVGQAMDKKYEATLLKAAAATLRGQMQDDPQPDGETVAVRG